MFRIVDLRVLLLLTSLIFLSVAFENPAIKNAYPQISCKQVNLSVLLMIDTCFAIDKDIFQEVVDIYLKKEETRFSRVEFSVWKYNDSSCESVFDFGDILTKSELMDSLSHFSTKSTKRCIYTRPPIVKVIKQRFRRLTPRENHVFTSAIITKDMSRPLPESVYNELWDDYYSNHDYYHYRLNVLNLGLLYSPSPSKTLPRVIVVNYHEETPLTRLYKMCAQCPKGWMTWVLHHSSQEESDLTKVPPACYLIASSNKDISSYEANDFCRKKGASLASFETTKEWKFLYEQVQACFTRSSFIEPALNSRNNACPKMAKDLDAFKIHFGLRRHKTRWGGSAYRWLSGTPLLMRRGEYYSKWSYSRFCTIAVFNNCRDNVCKDIREKHVVCWVKETPNYVCEYPSEYFHWSFGGFVESIQSNSLSRPLNMRKCYLKKGKYIWMPLVSYSPEIRCVKEEYYLKGVKQQEEQQDFMKNGFPKFSCNNNGDYVVVGYDSLCNHFKDCPNDFDEDCSYSSLHVSKWSGFRDCTTEEFTCENGQCIPQYRRCDLYFDCIDESDEKKCDTCQHYTCPTGECIPKSLVSDGFEDCQGGGDEKETNRKEDCLFIKDGTKCVNASLRQLEWSVAVENATYVHCEAVASSQPWAPRCFYLLDKYGIVIGCRDLSHLKDCEEFHCASTYYKCQVTGYCIPPSYIGNSVKDCPLGEDEYIEVLNSAFYCSSLSPGSRFVAVDQVCDGQVDCPGGTDESDCEFNCPPGFICAAGVVMVSEPEKINNLSFIDNSIKYLNLSGLDLGSVFKNGSNSVFCLQPYFTEVRLLILSGCQIDEIYTCSDDAPKNFKLLHLFDISRNNLVNYPADVDSIYTDLMTYLKVFNLSGNSKLINVDGLLRQKYLLEVLDLSNTGISSVPPVVKQLENLKYLNLSGSRVCNLRQGTFPPSLLSLRLTAISSHLTFEKYTFKGLTRLESLNVSFWGLCCSVVLSEDVNSEVCQSTDDSFSSCNELMDSSFFVAFLVILATVSFTLNVMSLFYKFHYEYDMIGKSHGVITTHLDIADILMACYLITIAVQTVRFHGSYGLHDHIWRTSWACSIMGFISTASLTAAVFFVSFITLDRYLCVKHPLSMTVLPKSYAHILCCAGWVLAGLVSMIPLIDREHWGVYSSLSVCNGLASFRKRSDAWYYGFMLYTIVFSVVFLSTCYGQFAIFKTLAIHHRSFKEMSVSKLMIRLHKLESHIARRLLLVVLVNFICWFPVAIINIMSLLSIEGDKLVQGVSSVLILPLSSVLNPLLYTAPRIITYYKSRREETDSCDATDDVEYEKTKKYLVRVILYLARAPPKLETTSELLNRTKVIFDKLRLASLESAVDNFVKHGLVEDYLEISHDHQKLCSTAEQRVSLFQEISQLRSELVELWKKCSAMDMENRSRRASVNLTVDRWQYSSLGESSSNCRWINSFDGHAKLNRNEKSNDSPLVSTKTNTEQASSQKKEQYSDPVAFKFSVSGASKASPTLTSSATDNSSSVYENAQDILENVVADVKTIKTESIKRNGKSSMTKNKTF